MIQAIVFDMGNVLAHETWGKARLAEFDQLLGWEPGTLHHRLCSGPVWEAYSTGAITPDEYWAQVGAPVEDRLPPEFLHFKDNFYGAELDIPMIKLAWRLGSRYPIALLSNASPFLADGILQKEPFLGLFDTITISAQVGMRKPDPAIFHIPGQLLGIDTAACLLIDDKERNIQAAHKEGMPAILHKDAAGTELALQKMGIQTH